jgi:polysaccharide export outer membrane protein
MLTSGRGGRRGGGLPVALAIAVSAVLSGCAWVPSAGPTTGDLNESASVDAPIEVVDLTPQVLGQLRTVDQRRTFAEGLRASAAERRAQLGIGDTIAVSVWEAPPATLFGGSDTMAAAGTVATARTTTFPEQVIDERGAVAVPFVGRIQAAGLELHQLEAEITRRLAGKANHPQVLVRLARNASTDVTVVGDVNTSTRVPLSPKGERLLDALAAAGGVRQPVGKVTLQVTRGAQVFAMPLDAVIRDPRQNVPLRAGDVVTALYQPASFMAFGATGRNEEINFEGQGISLAQALARAGGLLDARADARGVFVFRLTSRSAGDTAAEGAVNAAGHVPVVYRLDMKNPASMFIAQQFQMRDKDTLYVSNAPMADIQKIANLFYSIAFPAVSVGAQFR